MNHSHYLMLDDGTIRDYDTKQYRTHLAIYMARLQHDNDVIGMCISLAKSIFRFFKVIIDVFLISSSCRYYCGRRW